MTHYRDPKLLIALLIIALFWWAFVLNSGDQTMIGALIGGFNMAIGYFLGSSSGASTNRDQLGKALDIAAAAQPPAQPSIVLKPGETARAADAPE